MCFSQWSSLEHDGCDVKSEITCSTTETSRMSVTQHANKHEVQEWHKKTPDRRCFKTRCVSKRPAFTEVSPRARMLFCRTKKKRMSCPHVPNGQLSCLLHIYMSSRIQWTWFGVIQSGSVYSIMFTKSKTQKKAATLYPWASQNVPNGQ